MSKERNRRLWEMQIGGTEAIFEAEENSSVACRSVVDFGPDLVGLLATIHLCEESAPWPPMSATTLSLTVEPGVLDARSSWRRDLTKVPESGR